MNLGLYMDKLVLQFVVNAADCLLNIFDKNITVYPLAAK